jgi:lysophospholipase L1-like esterase
VNLYVFGDSISQGYFDRRGGWVARLWEPVVDTGRAPQHYIYNVSISGDITRDVLQRFEPEAKRRGIQQYPSVVMITTGVNDAFRDDSGLRLDLDSTESDLRDLVDEAREHAETVVLMGCTPVDPEDNLVPNTGYRIRNKDLERIDDLKRRLSEGHDGVDFVDLHARLDTESFSWHDGIHPDTDGHRRIYEAVREPLASYLE